MSTQLVNCKSDQLYGGTDTSSVFHFTLSNSVFIGFYNEQRGMGLGGVFAPGQMHQFWTKVRDIETQMQSPLSSLSLKLIGKPADLERAKADLERVGAKNIVLAKELNQDETEIYYYPGENRIRLAVAQSSKSKVIIVDDSKTMRILIRKLLSSDSDIEILGEANGPSELMSLLEKHRPDVITLDIHMPEMNGVELLKKYLPKYPIPTVIVTSLSKEESPLVFDALENGAVEYIQKPSSEDFVSISTLMVEKVRAAAKAKIVKKLQRVSQQPITHCIERIDDSRLVAIGSSTGGTEALKEIFLRLPSNIPPILVVQHIPPIFSQALAARLNNLCPFEIKEAADGDEVRRGRVLIAPGGKQMKVRKTPSGLCVAIDDSAPVNRHKPSVDYLFHSLAMELGSKVIGIILTGMGNDGAQGLLEMKQRGAHTIAQDEASCVVFGMPKEAIKLGAATEVAPLLDIPEKLLRFLAA